jgi:hypothetical protein
MCWRHGYDHPPAERSVMGCPAKYLLIQTVQRWPDNHRWANRLDLQSNLHEMPMKASFLFEAAFTRNW